MAVVITQSRYGGTYEPGAWLAFPDWPESDDWQSDDVTCGHYFAAHAWEVGGGETPDEALADLLRKQQRRQGA